MNLDVVDGLVQVDDELVHADGIVDGLAQADGPVQIDGAVRGLDAADGDGHARSEGEEEHAQGRARGRLAGQLPARPVAGRDEIDRQAEPLAKARERFGLAANFKWDRRTNNLTAG